MQNMRTIGTHHCGNTRLEKFKHRLLFQDVFCCRDYYEIVVDSFLH